MKRLLICFLGAVLLVASLVILVGAQALDEPAVQGDTREAWQIYMEDKLWPTVASIGTSVFGIYLMVSPVLSRMNKSSGTLGGAAKEFAAAIAELKKSNERNSTQEERIATLEAERERWKEQFEAERERQEKALRETEARFAQLCRVFAIGWGADEQMVKSGAAREMMKVVEAYEGREEE